MRIIFLLTAFLIGGAALAQTSLQGYWAGISVGAPATSLHFGVEDILGDGVDLRGNLGFSYLYTSGVYLGADALFDLDMNTGTVPLDTYLGAGAFASIGGGFGLGIQGLFGGEYRLVEAGLPEGGVFLELGPDLYLAPRPFFGFTGRFGFNYHF
jgi:hypothetical protein